MICLNNRSQVAEYRRKTSAEIVTQANQIRAKHARSTGTLTLSSVMVQAARQLKSGDIRLTVRDAKEAEILRVHREKWVKGFGRTAFVHMPTWGVIMHGVQVKSLVDKPSVEALRKVQASKGEAIVAQNHHGWGDATISKISWLRVPREGTKLASIILEFTTPQAANLAIQHGVLWDSNLYQAVLYDRAIRVRQCFNCQQYGHIGTSCSNNMKCVYCAAEHQSRDCPTRIHGENSAPIAGTPILRGVLIARLERVRLSRAGSLLSSEGCFTAYQHRSVSTSPQLR